MSTKEKLTEILADLDPEARDRVLKAYEAEQPVVTTKIMDAEDFMLYALVQVGKALTEEDNRPRLAALRVEVQRAVDVMKQIEGLEDTASPKIQVTVYQEPGGLTEVPTVVSESMPTGTGKAEEEEDEKSEETAKAKNEEEKKEEEEEEEKKEDVPEKEQAEKKLQKSEWPIDLNLREGDDDE